MTQKTSASQRKNEGERRWYVYLLECEGGSIYTGITTDLRRRMTEHAAGTAARFTRAFSPLRLRAAWRCADRSTATAAEQWIKRLGSKQKRQLDSGAGSIPNRYDLTPVCRRELSHAAVPADRSCPPDRSGR